MNLSLKIALGSLFIICLINCKHEIKKVNQENVIEPIKQELPEVAGNYVSDYYQNRNEGYDWIAISVKNIGENTIGISVRSRADKKKPTCTLDTKANKVNDSLFTSAVNGLTVMFTFHKDTLNISTERPEQADGLQYYCSGGGNFIGNYARIDGDLDQTQIDRTIFSRTLELQGIGFLVSSTTIEFGKELQITPYGLEVDNNPITHIIEGTVINAEIEDLNSDGFPELLVYLSSDGSGSYGDVIGYSVNNGKSISAIYFPPVSENDELKKGYMGHDEFSVIETTLAQRFPIYKEGDTNANPTGGIRQIEYQLVDGEASRKFVIKNSTDFPEKN